MRYIYIVSACSALIGIGFFIFMTTTNESGSSETLTHSFPADTSYFDRAEYYFHDQTDVDQPYDRELARFYYQKAIAEGEDNALLWYQLGRLDFLDGDHSSSIDRFNKQIELYGDVIPNVYYSLGLSYGFRGQASGNVEDWRAGADNFEIYLTYEPDNPWTRTDLAWVLFSMGEYEEMIPVLEVGLETHPDHPWLLNMYGLALMNSGQSDRAGVVFERGLENAKKLTVEDWGRAYSGNLRAGWEPGLRLFIMAIEKNIELTTARSSN